MKTGAGKPWSSATARSTARLFLAFRAPASSAGLVPGAAAAAGECALFRARARGRAGRISRLPALPSQGCGWKSAVGAGAGDLPLHRAAHRRPAHARLAGEKFRRSPFHLQRTVQGRAGRFAQGLHRCLPPAPGEAESASRTRRDHRRSMPPDTAPAAGSMSAPRRSLA